MVAYRTCLFLMFKDVQKVRTYLHTTLFLPFVSLHFRLIIQNFRMNEYYCIFSSILFLYFGIFTRFYRSKYFSLDWQLEKKDTQKCDDDQHKREHFLVIKILFVTFFCLCFLFCSRCGVLFCYSIVLSFMFMHVLYTNKKGMYSMKMFF